MLGRTYSTGYEPDLEYWLLKRPIETVLNTDWPWAIWYPLRRGSWSQSRHRRGWVSRPAEQKGRTFRLASANRPKHEGVVSVRLFIGNLPYSATEPDLREHLSSVGAPAQIVLPTDRETGRPRGFAFVDYAEREVAEEAIRRFNQQPFKGRPLAVSEARPREDRPPGAGPRPGGYSSPRPGGAPSGFSSPQARRLFAATDRRWRRPAGIAQPELRPRRAAQEQAQATAQGRPRTEGTDQGTPGRHACTTTTKTGARRTSRRSSSTISRPARRRTNWRKTKARWTRTSASSAS